MDTMDKKSFVIANLLRNLVFIYFDTFFAIYYFNLINNNVFELGKYYFFVYLFSVLSFWILKKAIKNFKVPYYRLGISFTAFYLMLIMLLKEKIVDYIVIVALFKGLGDGLYWYPRNIMNATKITNAERRKHLSIINSIAQICSIIVPILLGVLLTYFDYVQIGKVVFLIIIVVFILSYFTKEELVTRRKDITLKEFLHKLKTHKKVRQIFIIQFLKGFTISGGVLTVVMSIYKILYFKSNLYIGTLNSIIGLVTFITCLIYFKISKRNYKIISMATLIIVGLSLLVLGIKPNTISFLVYLFVYATGVTIISLLSDNIVVNICTNDPVLSENKEEYHLVLESFLALARVLGYVLLMIIGLINQNLINVILILSIIPLMYLVYYMVLNIDDLE